MSKVALITGASSGIGRELAKELAIRHYNLILVSRRRNVLEGLAEELRDKYGVNAWPIDHDLSDLSRINELVDRVRGLGIEVSILVNNAGAGLWGGSSRLSWQ